MNHPFQSKKSITVRNHKDNLKNPVFNPFSNPHDIQTTAETQEIYKERALGIIKNAVKKIREITQRDVNEEAVDPRQVVGWLMTHRFTISQSTFRNYKASLLHYWLNENPSPEAKEAAYFLIKINSSASVAKSNRGAALKAKGAKEADFQRMMNWLRERKTDLSLQTMIFLQAGSLLGLRPTEWQSAVWTDYEGELCIRVKNAKSTNGRGNGEFRTLRLGNMPPEDIEIIKKQMYNAKIYKDAGKYKNWVESCAQCLLHANKALGNKKNITLYTGRHQFSSNAKQSRMSFSELAALMGHANDKTALSTYGNFRYGHGKSSVRAVEAEIETVNRTDYTQAYLNKQMGLDHLLELSKDKANSKQVLEAVEYRVSKNPKAKSNPKILEIMENLVHLKQSNTNVIE